MQNIENEKKLWAFFDLDYTLIKTDSYIPFLLGWFYRHPWRILFMLTLPVSILRYVIEKRERVYIKTAFLRAFMKGARKDAVEKYAVNFWRKFWTDKKNQTVIDRLIELKKSGYKIYIISGSFYFYTQYLNEYLPVDGIIGTKAEFFRDRVTGYVTGINCLGLEKVVRIQSDLGVRLSEITYEAFSDCRSDAPLMLYAKSAWLVKKNEIIRWPENYQT